MIISLVVAVQPGARRGRVTTCRVVYVSTLHFDGGQAFKKLGSRGVIVGAYDQCGA